MRKKYVAGILSLCVSVMMVWQILPALPAYAATCIITFNSGGGSYVAGIQDQAVGERIVRPADPVKENCLFLGWYDSALASKWDFDQPAAGSMVLYAKWGMFEEEFPEGDGKTEATAYRIYNAKQLNHVRSCDEAGRYFILMNDIDLSAWNTGSGSAAYTDGLGWMPIGDNTALFAGHFDGNGKVIKNILIKRNDDNIGFFGMMTDAASIKNLGVAGGSITGRKYTGGIVGRGYGSVTGCYNTASVKGMEYVGGIAGSVRNGFNFNGYIRSCYNAGAVESTGNNAGGIVGDNAKELSDCYNTGAVKAAVNYAGGIAGDNSGTVARCYNTGAVSALGKYGGGIAGSNSGFVNNCYNFGDVSGTTAAGSIVGAASIGEINGCYRYRLALVNNTVIAANNGQSRDYDIHGGAKAISDLWKKTTYTQNAWGMGAGDTWQWDDSYTYPKLSGLAGQAYPFGVYFDVSPVSQPSQSPQVNVTVTSHAAVTGAKWAAGTPETPATAFSDISGAINMPNGNHYLHLSGAAGEKTVTAVYGPYHVSRNYTVTFDSMGGSGITAVSAVPGAVISEPAAPVWEGHIFQGWYKESGYINRWDFTLDVVDYDKILYARWGLDEGVSIPTLDSNVAVNKVKIEKGAEITTFEAEATVDGISGTVYLVKYKKGVLTAVTPAGLKSGKLELSISAAASDESVYLMIWDYNMQPLIEKYLI